MLSELRTRMVRSRLSPRFGRSDIFTLITSARVHTRLPAPDRQADLSQTAGDVHLAVADDQLGLTQASSWVLLVSMRIFVTITTSVTKSK